MFDPFVFSSFQKLFKCYINVIKKFLTVGVDQRYGQSDTTFWFFCANNLIVDWYKINVYNYGYLCIKLMYVILVVGLLVVVIQCLSYSKLKKHTLNLIEIFMTYSLARQFNKLLLYYLKIVIITD